MENQTELKWFQKQTGIIILLILFFPVGLYLMWKNQLWTKKTRWIVSGVIAVLVIANYGKQPTSSSYSSSSSSSSYSSSSKVKCGYCSRSFKAGTGYSTVMRVISQPETVYSHYCSRKCAVDFLRSL